MGLVLRRLRLRFRFEEGCCGGSEWFSPSALSFSFSESFWAFALISFSGVVLFSGLGWNSILSEESFMKEVHLLGFCFGNNFLEGQVRARIATAA